MPYKTLEERLFSGELTKKEYERRKQWSNLPKDCKDYTKGQDIQEIQQEFPLDMQTPDNSALPLPKNSPRISESHPNNFPPETLYPNNNPNLYYPPFRPDRKHYLNTIHHQTFKRPYKQLLTSQPSQHSKTPKKSWPKYSGPPPEIAEQALKQFPQLPDSFFQQIFYMHSNLQYSFEQIALYYPTSPQQVQSFCSLCLSALSSENPNNEHMQLLRDFSAFSSIPDTYTPEHQRKLALSLSH